MADHQSNRGSFGLGFSELIGWLVWPRLLAAARLALRPARLGLSLVMLVLIGLIAQIPRLWGNPPDDPLATGSAAATEALAKIVNGVLRLDHVSAGTGLLDLFVYLPRELITRYPWSSLAVFIPALFVWAIGGGAIARTAATEFSLDRRTSWPRSLAFSLSRWGSLFSAMAAPLVVVALLVALMALLGVTLLGIAYANAVGGIFFFLILLLGAAAVIILTAYLLAMPMLVPAVACEGTDAIDGIQRCYAYVTGRPMKLVLYSVILLVQGVVVTVILGALAQAVVTLSLWASALLLPDHLHHAVLAQGHDHAESSSTLSATSSFAIGAVRFWVGLPMLLVASFVVSFWFSGGTVLYLLIRQVCDGQDTGELWTPGLIAGTHATPEADATAPTEGDEDE